MAKSREIGKDNYGAESNERLKEADDEEIFGHIRLCFDWTIRWRESFY